MAGRSCTNHPVHTGFACRDERLSSVSVLVSGTAAIYLVAFHSWLTHMQYQRPEEKKFMELAYLEEAQVPSFPVFVVRRYLHHEVRGLYGSLCLRYQKYQILATYVLNDVLAFPSYARRAVHKTFCNKIKKERRKEIHWQRVSTINPSIGKYKIECSAGKSTDIANAVELKTTATDISQS